MGHADIILISFSPANRKVYHIGNIYGVEQLRDTEIAAIRADLTQSWIAGQIRTDFSRIEDVQNPTGFNVYRQNNWNSQHISTVPPGGFVCNIRYQKLEIFKEKNWISLTDKDALINKKWRKLGKRYSLANATFNNALSGYLNSLR